MCTDAYGLALNEKTSASGLRNRIFAGHEKHEET